MKGILTLNSKLVKCYAIGEKIFLLFLALEEEKQADCKFKTSPSYLVNSVPAWATQ